VCLRRDAVDARLVPGVNERTGDHAEGGKRRRVGRPVGSPGSEGERERWWKAGRRKVRDVGSGGQDFSLTSGRRVQEPEFGSEV
jgi:hypothetical protein